METRKCYKCGELRAWPQSFVKSGKKTYGYCKVCNQKANRKWAENNRERVRAYAAKYYREHKQQFRDYKRNERIRNEVIRTQVKGA